MDIRIVAFRDKCDHNECSVFIGLDFPTMLKVPPHLISFFLRLHAAMATLFSFVHAVPPPSAAFLEQYCCRGVSGYLSETWMLQGLKASLFVVSATFLQMSSRNRQTQRSGKPFEAFLESSPICRHPTPAESGKTISECFNMPLDDFLAAWYASLYLCCILLVKPTKGPIPFERFS